MDEKEKRDLDKTPKETQEDVEENYMSMGMCYGVMAGCIGMSIFASFGQTALGSICIAIGISVGMLIGRSIPKNRE